MKHPPEANRTTFGMAEVRRMAAETGEIYYLRTPGTPPGEVHAALTAALAEMGGTAEAYPTGHTRYSFPNAREEG